MHHYRVTSRWSGSTGTGYERYDRTHSVSTTPPTQTLTLSADPAFRGDPARLDPEELFVIATSSCQLLSFLAVAARARIDVVEYDDDAEGFMPDGLRPMRITEIVLHPRITVRGKVTEDRVRHLCEVAHRECYIANSVTTEIVVEPVVVVVDGRSTTTYAPTRMGAAENLDIHSRCTEAENRHDLSQHADFFHDDIEVVVAGGMATTGVDEYRAGLESLYEGMSDFKVVLEDQLATDDRVVCRWRATATHDGDYYGIPASGKSVEYTGVSVWEFDGGKARRGWIFPDNMTLMQQLGFA